MAQDKIFVKTTDANNCTRGEPATGTNYSGGVTAQDVSVKNTPADPVYTLPAVSEIKQASNLLDSGSVTINVENTVVEVTLDNSESYNTIDFLVSASPDCTWTFYHDDDGTENYLFSFFLSSDDGPYANNMGNFEFSTGATGTQKLVVKGNPKKVSDLHAAVSCAEKST